jgi:hypothetical protein
MKRISNVTETRTMDKHIRPKKRRQHSASSGRSTYLWQRLVRARNWVKPDRESRQIDETNNTYTDLRVLKLYMLVARSRGTHTSKNLSVYIGRSANTGEKRAAAHNDTENARRVLDQRTRPNAGKWEFCMWANIPTQIRTLYHTKHGRSFSKLLQSYWNASHGLKSKVKRGLEIIAYFGLEYGVTQTFEKIVSQVELEQGINIDK